MQLGFDTKKKFSMNKPETGHLKDIKIGDDDAVTVSVLRDCHD